MKCLNQLKVVATALSSLLILALPAHAGDGDNEFKGSYGGCAKYKITVYNGDGALRLMSNPKDLRRTSNGTSHGQLCASGRVKIELAKRNVGTHIKLNLNGKKYYFGEGDDGHKHLNGWYRKYINVKLPQVSSYRPNHGHNNHEYAYRPYDYGNNNRYGYSDGHNYRQNHGHNSGYGHNNHYGYRNNHNSYGQHQHHGHQRRHHNVNKPWFHVNSKKHRKAHKYGWKHIHRGEFIAMR